MIDAFVTYIQSERMENRKIAQYSVIFVPADGVDDRSGISCNIVVTQHDPFGNAGTSAGKEDDRCFVYIVPCFRRDKFHQFFRIEKQYGNTPEEPFEAQLYFRIKILHKDHFASGFHFQLFEETSAGKDYFDFCFFHRLIERIRRGCIIEDRRDLVGKKYRKDG